MVKKLYITGAGASKDLNSKNLLGSELLDQIKNHRFYIYYWLIAMVVARVCSNFFSNVLFINLIRCSVPDIINSFHKKNTKINFDNCNKLPELISEFIDELLSNIFCRTSLEKLNIKIEIKKILLTDGRIFKEKFQNKDLEYLRTAIYHIMHFETKPFYYQELMMTTPNQFKKGLDFVLNYIFEVNKDNSLIEIKEYFKQEVICGIVLSFIVKGFSSDNNSIDNIINFLESLSFYGDSYANKYDLPNVEKIKKFAVVLVQDIIIISFHSSEYNYIEYLHQKIFSRKSEELKSSTENINFINFNYDPSLSEFFGSLSYDLIVESVSSDLRDRKHNLIALKNKIEQSHMYGMIDLNYDHINPSKNLCFLPFFSDCMTFFEEHSYDIKEIMQERQNPKLSLIRTKPTEDQITANFAKIKNSDEIYILGFGFDEYNLKNMGISASDAENLKKIEKKTVYATNYGDLPRIRLALERIFAVKLYKESELQEDGKKHSFWRSRDDATNKRGNNVFVSTKPVYRALTEDFL